MGIRGFVGGEAPNNISGQCYIDHWIEPEIRVRHTGANGVTLNERKESLETVQ